MIKRSFVGLIVAVALVLAGCASKAPKQAFNKSAHADIKSIVLLEPGSIKEYEVVNLGHAGMSFGLIGGLIAAADISSKTGEFTKLMAERQFKGESEYQQALISALQKAGYVVSVKAVKRNELELLKTYSGIEADGDAFLDSTLKAGFYSSSGGTDYVPLFRSHVRLVQKGSGDVLYEEQVAYGYENRYEDAVGIAGTPSSSSLISLR